MGKIQERLFKFLRDWLSQSRVEFRLILENVRLRKEIRRKNEVIARRDAYILTLKKIISYTYYEGKGKIDAFKEEAAVEKNQLLGVIEEQRLQLRHLNSLLFECCEKSDAAERSQK